MADDDRGTFTSKILAGGQDPDPRFTLANERTFLAWIRTSLALVAGAIAVEGFTAHLLPPTIRIILGATLAIIALILAVVSAFRWLRVERAMRARKALPLPILVPVLSVGIAGAIIVFLLFLFGWLA